MSEYDSAKACADLRREFDESPDLGEDWREKVHDGDVEDEVGFAFDKDFSVVGHGEKTRVECGKFKRFMVCLRLKNHAGVHVDGVDYTNKVFHKRQWWYCKRPECPVCFKKGWAVNEARHAEERLKFASVHLGMKGEHIIMSPPQVEFESFEALKKATLKAMLVRGIVGGLFVYHHFRYHHKDETFVGERAHYFKAVHFHAVGFIKGGYGNCRTCRYQLDKTFVKCRECNGFEGVTRRAYEKDGFIAKVKGERKTIGGTVWYELSHASLRVDVEKNVVVNWFGVCGRNKLKIPKGSLPQKENLCEICGEKLYHGRYLGDCREYLMWLDVQRIRRSAGVVADYLDKDGKPQWEVVIKCGERAVE